MSGVEFQVSGFGFRVSGFGFQFSGFGFRVSGFGFRVSGFGSRFSVFGFRVSGFGSRVSGFGSRVSGVRARGYRVHALDPVSVEVAVEDDPLGVGPGRVRALAQQQREDAWCHPSTCSFGLVNGFPILIKLRQGLINLHSITVNE